MLGVGIIEGFFGPEWSWQSRLDICASLSRNSGDFFIYAPKRDAYLRKSWTSDHPDDSWKNLINLSSAAHKNKIAFGVGLSPFEIHTHWNPKTQQQLKEKILKLQDLDIDILGLFFDDMVGAPDLAEKQIEIVNFVQNHTDTTLLFCPTYYSDDPILDKVFGARPVEYLEKIGKYIPAQVEILWTGKKVISPTILAEDLNEVSKTLKRKPLIWDNYFANDGPRQCKYLRLKPFEGRNSRALEASAGWALNLMNQAHLSMALAVSSIDVLKNRTLPEESYIETLKNLAGQDLMQTILKFETQFNEVGLDKLDPKIQADIRASINSQNPFGEEIINWLEGHYVVGPECLTD